ncbi:MAG: F0F1 ATP synthase subunit A [Planctomycetes bacterium]|nr:F0F1 ATP synthase subunit A [Planctomycetota bacterium]
MFALLAAHDPVDHVLPHTFFKFPLDLRPFGLESIPLLNFPLGSGDFVFTNHLLMTLVAAGLCLLLFPWLARVYARGAAEPRAPRGLANLVELVLQFIREDVVRPTLKHRTDQFIPFLWTLFFFILFCNLLGMIPLADIIYLLSGRTVQYVGGTATGNLAITGGLAICAFFLIHVSGVREVYRGLIAGTYGHHHEKEEDDTEHEHAAARAHHAATHSAGQARFLALPLYIWNFAPHVFAKTGPRSKPSLSVRAAMVVVYTVLVALEVRGIFTVLSSGSAIGGAIGQWFGAVLGFIAAICAGGLHWTDVLDVVMWGFIWLLELIGAIIKPFALMIRLFANMIAGHIVLASILALVFTTSSVAMGYTVGVISSIGCALLSMLEVFVALLQAYIFVFLTTLFISMSVEPEH